MTRLIPEAEVLLTGSASIEGLDAEDIDLVVLVPNVLEAASRLRALFPPLYEDLWRDDWAGFRIPGRPYRALKRDRTDYESRKAAFFERVVELSDEPR